MEQFSNTVYGMGFGDMEAICHLVSRIHTAFQACIVVYKHTPLQHLYLNSQLESWLSCAALRGPGDLKFEQSWHREPRILLRL